MTAPATSEKVLAVSGNQAATEGPSRQVAVQNGNHSSGEQDRELFNLPGLSIRRAGPKLIATLSGDIIAATTEPSQRRELIDRLFSISALQFARILGQQGEWRLEFDAARIAPERIVTSLAEAMTGPRPASLSLPHEEVILDDDAPTNFSVRRAEAGLTLWEVDALSSQFFRISHPLLRQDFVHKKVQDELSTLSDVILRTLHIPLAGRESLLIFGRPHRVDPTVFREVLDPVLSVCLEEGPETTLPKVKDVLVNSNLAIAALTDFLFPPLGIANIALTGTLGVGYVPRALLALREGKVTLELLYLVIASFTILTYEFLPAAIMYWLMRYWPRRSQQLYDSHYSRFLSRYRLRPRRVWVDHAGTAVETRVKEITAASVVTLNSGDIVPGDGVIVEGDAQLDEAVLTGAAAPVAKSNGHEIYAATRIVEGSVRIKINALAHNTAVGRLARWHEDSHVRDLAPTIAHESAEKTVLPVLLVSALATLYGGLATAKAVIRPDYFSGPALAENLDRLASVIRAANEGILVPTHSSLKRLTGPISLVLDDSVSWKASAANELFYGLALEQGVAEAVYFSKQSADKAAETAGSWGIPHFIREGAGETKKDYIARRQREGASVIYVGNCRAENRAARQADLAISVAEPPFDRLEKSTITLLSPDLLKILQLRAIAQDSADDLKTAFQISTVPNVAAVVAGFAMASPVYLSILLTSLGTLTNQVRSEALLQLTALSRPRS